MAPLLLISGDFVETGGMDRCNHALAHYCAGRGQEVHLVGHRAADNLLSLPTVHFHRLPRLLGSYALSEPLLDRAGRARGKRIAAQGGRVLVNGGNCGFPDINWVNHIHAADGAFAAGRPWNRLRRRLVFWNDRRRERRLIPRANLIITSCHRNKDEMVRRFGVPENKIEVVYLGVDAARFRPATAEEIARTRASLGLLPDRRYVLFVGALTNRRKGFDTLFAAWQRLCADPTWDCDLLVVGRGAEVPAWQARAAEAGLAGRIRFMGFVPDLAALMAACNAHALPSRYEGYSLATQEALACGLPALVTAGAGFAERYPRELHDLLLPSPEDAEDLAARLRRWRQHEIEARAAVREFSDELRRNTWERMAANVATIIDANPCPRGHRAAAPHC
jgi:glycosyltransferase involved in cell wall biosynthesis